MTSSSSFFMICKSTTSPCLNNNNKNYPNPNFGHLPSPPHCPKRGGGDTGDWLPGDLLHWTAQQSDLPIFLRHFPPSLEDLKEHHIPSSFHYLYRPGLRARVSSDSCLAFVTLGEAQVSLFFYWWSLLFHSSNILRNTDWRQHWLWQMGKRLSFLKMKSESSFHQCTPTFSCSLKKL